MSEPSSHTSHPGSSNSKAANTISLACSPPNTHLSLALWPIFSTLINSPERARCNHPRFICRWASFVCYNRVCVFRRPYISTCTCVRMYPLYTCTHWRKCILAPSIYAATRATIFPIRVQCKPIERNYAPTFAHVHAHEEISHSCVYACIPFHLQILASILAAEYPYLNPADKCIQCK